MNKLTLTILLGTSVFASNGAELIQQNGCTACHAIASKKQAPAFAGIAKRNLRFYGTNAKNIIINSIKNGSNGKYPKFNYTAMPSFNNFTNQQLDDIATYILLQSNKAKNNHNHMGKGHSMRNKTFTGGRL